MMGCQYEQSASALLAKPFSSFSNGFGDDNELRAKKESSDDNKNEEEGFGSSDCGITEVDNASSGS